jgi:hypothetical protein
LNPNMVNWNVDNGDHNMKIKCQLMRNFENENGCCESWTKTKNIYLFEIYYLM